MANGDEILDSFEQAFRRWTVQQASQDFTALALWTLYTHAAPAFDYAPRLVLTSAEKRSGKSRTMEIASALSRAPIMTASASPAALYRSVPEDASRTITVFADEADTIFGQNAKSETAEALRGFINAGFRRGYPTIRCEGPSNTVRTFYTFSPVCLAAIGHLPDTVTDRAVNIRLRRRKASEKVDSYRLRTDEPALRDLAESASQWADENLEEIANYIPRDVPVDDRAADLWEPLIAVADIAGGTWPQKARDAARHHTGAEADDEDESTGIEMLRDIEEVLDLHQSDRIGSTNLVEMLKAKEESRWAEEDLKPRRLAITLKEFGIRPTRMPSGKGNGYWIHRFEDAFERYLTPSVALSTPPPSQKLQKVQNPGATSSDEHATSAGRVPSNIHASEKVHGRSPRSDRETATSATSAGGTGGDGDEEHLGPHLFDEFFGTGGDAA